MKKCCGICVSCEENICLAHSKGYEAIVRYPFSQGTECGDFEEDTERSEYFDSMTEEERQEMIRDSVYRPEE